jgi:putative PIN family toxin of toxin-antitoxin system
MKTEPAYVVIDTNVLISAGLLAQSKTAQVLALAVEHFVIAQNEQTWRELETRIAWTKFDRYFGDTGRLEHLVKIAQSTEFFKVSASVSVSRDATDDKFIPLAMDAGASILISGDPDLLEVRTHQGIEILSPALFFNRFKPPSL